MIRAKLYPDLFHVLVVLTRYLFNELLLSCKIHAINTVNRTKFCTTLSSTGSDSYCGQ